MRKMLYYFELPVKADCHILGGPVSSVARMQSDLPDIPLQKQLAPETIGAGCRLAERNKTSGWMIG